MLNNNFNELVKKYDRYTSKRRKKKFLSLLGLAAIIAGGFFLVMNSQYIINSFKKTTPESQVQIEPTKIQETPAVTEKEKKVEKTVIKESIKPIKKAETEVKPLKRVKVKTPKTEDLPNRVYKRKTKKIEKSNPFQLEVKERKNLYLLLTTDKNQNSYKSAIDVAKFYFDEKNYDQAVVWAVKASKKDPRKSLPWIIYAKSKASLGETKVAKKALSIYLKHINSKEVRDLLDSLK